MNIGKQAKEKKEKIDKFSDKDSYDYNYIIYKNNKFAPQIDICACLKNQESLEQEQAIKIVVLIEKNAPIRFLNEKIIEELEKYSQYKNLQHLKIINLHEISLKGEKTMLPTEGVIEDVFKENGKIIYFEVVSNEYWIKTIFQLKCLKKTQMIQIEYKINAFMLLERFKVFLLKSGIYYFKNNLQSKINQDQLTFLIQNVEFLIYYNTKNKNYDTINYNDEVNDLKDIGSLFGFEGKIICSISFDIFERIIFHKIQNDHIPNSKKSIHWSEFSELTFEKLFTEKVFIHERKAILLISKDLIRKEVDTIRESINDVNYYFYNADSCNSQDIISNHNSYSENDKSKKQIVFVLSSHNEDVRDYNNNASHSYTKAYATHDSPHSHLIEDTFVDIKRNMKINNKNFKTFSETPLLPTHEGNEALFRDKPKDYDDNVQNTSFEEQNRHTANNLFRKMRAKTVHHHLFKELIGLFEYKEIKNVIQDNYYKICFAENERLNIEMPECRYYAVITSEDIINRDDSDNKNEPVVKINNTKILIFVMMALAYYIGAVICIYYDYL